MTEKNQRNKGKPIYANKTSKLALQKTYAYASDSETHIHYFLEKKFVY